MKKVMTALLAAGALVALAACGGNSDDNSSGSGSGASNEKVTLKFQSLAFQKTTVAATKKIVADWNAANPNIQVTVNKQDGGDAAVTKLLTAIKAGSGAPDIMQAEYQKIPTLVAAQAVADISGDVG